MNHYLKLSALLKALSDPTRLQILDILSCGKKCACEILNSLQIGQPTLSHHMKVLTNCDLVTGEKQATWMHYSLNRKKIAELQELITTITSPKDECICNNSPKIFSDGTTE